MPAEQSTPTTIILNEVRCVNSTLRFRKAGNGDFVVEKWDRADQNWNNVYAHQDFYVAMHVYFDEICKQMEYARRYLKG